MEIWAAGCAIGARAVSVVGVAGGVVATSATGFMEEGFVGGVEAAVLRSSGGCAEVAWLLGGVAEGLAVSWYGVVVWGEMWGGAGVFLPLGCVAEALGPLVGASETLVFWGGESPVLVVLGVIAKVVRFPGGYAEVSMLCRVGVAVLRLLGVVDEVRGVFQLGAVVSIFFGDGAEVPRFPGGVAELPGFSGGGTVVSWSRGEFEELKFLNRGTVVRGLFRGGAKVSWDFGGKVEVVGLRWKPLGCKQGIPPSAEHSTLPPSCAAASSSSPESGTKMLP